MALAQTQALLARLFTDAALRREFFEAPLEVAGRFGLDEADARIFSGIDRAEVEMFARSLLGKRALDLRKAMPLTARALGQQFDVALMNAAERNSAGSDAAMLAHHVEGMCEAGDCPNYVADVARFELAFIEAAQPGIRVKRFRYDIAAIASVLRAGGDVEATPRAMIGVWGRAPGARLRWAIFGAPALYARR